MKKTGKGILGYIIVAIAFVLLSVIAFATPFHKANGTFWIALIINVVFLAAAALGSIATKVMKEEIIRQDIVVERDTTNMRKLQKYSAELLNLCKDEEARKIVSKIAEEIRYSDPVSGPKTMQFEEDLMFALSEYEGIIVAGDNEEIRKKGDRIIRDLAARNMVCELGK